MIFSYNKQYICETIIIVFLILLDRILNFDCIVNNGNILTNADGNVITKWEKESFIEVEISKRQTVYKIRTVNIF